jgi:hypothetical protein
LSTENFKMIIKHFMQPSNHAFIQAGYIQL